MCQETDMMRIKCDELSKPLAINQSAIKMMGRIAFLGHVRCIKAKTMKDVALRLAGRRYAISLTIKNNI